MRPAEPAAQNPVERAEHGRAASLPAEPTGEQLHDEEAWHEQDREGEHSAGRGVGVKAALKAGPELRVKQLQHGDRDDPGEKRDHLVYEPADEADRGAADQEQENEDVERGHCWRASKQ